MLYLVFTSSTIDLDILIPVIKAFVCTLGYWGNCEEFLYHTRTHTAIDPRGLLLVVGESAS